MCDADYLFLKDAQKRGLSPSKVFQDAILRIKRQIDMGIDLSEGAIEAKFKRYQDHIQKITAYLDKRGLLHEFLEEERNERNQI